MVRGHVTDMSWTRLPDKCLAERSGSRAVEALQAQHLDGVPNHVLAALGRAAALVQRKGGGEAERESPPSYPF